MFTQVLVAILFSAVPADQASTFPAPTDDLKISIGAMSFSGDTMKLTKSEGEAFDCVVEGHARFCLGSGDGTDISIAATKLVITRKANAEATIECIGECKLTDSDYACSADRMQIKLAKQMGIQMSGRSRVEYGIDDDRTTLTGEAISIQDGAFSTSGNGSLERSR